MNRKERGQNLVEFMLILPILIIVIAGMIDLGPLVFDLFAAKQMSARGARAGSVYLTDGIRNCYSDAKNAIGDPHLISADWDSEISANCDSNPLDTHAMGEPITVKINVDYTPLFLGSFGYPPKAKSTVWSFSVQTIDQSR